MFEVKICVDIGDTTAFWNWYGDFISPKDRCEKSENWNASLVLYFKIHKKYLGCARFAEIASELTKAWSSGATESGVQLQC